MKLSEHSIILLLFCLLRFGLRNNQGEVGLQEEKYARDEKTKKEVATGTKKVVYLNDFFQKLNDFCQQIF